MVCLLRDCNSVQTEMAEEDNFSEGSHHDEYDEGDISKDEVGKEQDLSKDGKLVKVIHTLGTGWEKPSRGAEVTVHYTGQRTFLRSHHSIFLDIPKNSPFCPDCSFL